MPDFHTKKGWTQIAFGDVVQLTGERSSDPVHDGFERYVGLEHIEPGDLKIRRWGDTADGTTFTSVFRSGQVLFGKRRAYQRKVAVADFDGVCSGDIYVLEPRNNHVLSELLPFICQTNGFFEHAVGTSAGSLSPRTNWGSLATYEFVLPPLEEQQRIADSLGASQRLCTARQDLLLCSRALFGSTLTALVLGGASTGEFRSSALGRVPSHWEVRALGELASFANGVSKPAAAFGSGAPMVNLNDMFGETFLDEVPQGLVQVSKAELDALAVRKGDILFVRSSVKPEGVGHAVMIEADFKDVVFAGFIIRCRFHDNRVHPRFANYLFQEPHFRRLMLSRSTVSLNTNINQQELASMPVAIPPIEEQTAATDVLDLARFGVNRIERQLEQGLKLRDELMTCLFASRLPS